MQLRFEASRDLILRATYSTTLARPGFNQSNVSLAVDSGSGTVTQGNPNLRPATANSFDVTVERYLGASKIISIGGSYKTISGYIMPTVLRNQDLPSLLPGSRGIAQVIIFIGANDSYARGIEANVDYNFRTLPGLLGGFGLSGDFTFVDSRSETRPGEFSQLPSMSRYIYNAALFYEKEPVTLRVAAYSASTDLFGIGQDKTSDVYNATRTSLDFGASYAFSRHLVGYFDAKNLLDTPHAFSLGTPDRPIQREFYRQTYQAGIRFDF